jgi:hypothetical protein
MHKTQVRNLYYFIVKLLKKSFSLLVRTETALWLFMSLWYVLYLLLGKVYKFCSHCSAQCSNFGNLTGNRNFLHCRTSTVKSLLKEDLNSHLQKSCLPLHWRQVVTSYEDAHACFDSIIEPSSEKHVQREMALGIFSPEWRRCDFKPPSNQL